MQTPELAHPLMTIVVGALLSLRLFGWLKLRPALAHATHAAPYRER
jgi:hypothetical protein